MLILDIKKIIVDFMKIIANNPKVLFINQMNDYKKAKLPCFLEKSNIE